MMGLLVELFGTFFLLGLFNFGGGIAMISLIQTQIVSVHGWISESAFADIVAISQSTPGPVGINCATYVGYEVMHSAGYGAVVGIIGSAVTTFALVLPSFLLFFIIMGVYYKFRSTAAFGFTMSALKPVTSGLIISAAILLTIRPDFSIITGNFPDWKAWCIFGGVFLVSLRQKTSPVMVILLSGLLGLVIF